MSRWLRKGRGESSDPFQRDKRRDLDTLLPASVLTPEVHRFASADPGEADDDADLAFLTSIAHEVDREVTSKRDNASIDELFGSRAPQRPPDDAMQFFYDMEAERTQDRSARPRLNLHVADVDMADLLEDLNTTVAALRQRKAA